MILKIGCPSCSKVYKLKDPLPPEGKKYRCSCGTVLVVTYPQSVRDLLRDKGRMAGPGPEEAAREDHREAERKAAEAARKRAEDEAKINARIEAERKAQEEAERSAREEAERRAREEAERDAREEAERKAAEEAARKAREEAELAARIEADRKAREELARRLAEEADQKEIEEAARLEVERLAQLEAEKKAAEVAARLEAERKAALEAARLEAERKAAEVAARLEAERKAALEAARLEAERKAAEEAARLEAERKAAEEAARLEAEREAAEEAARLEAEREAAEEAARLEAERKAAEEAARLEAERKAAEEAARLEAERKAALEAERKAAEEAARLEAERKAALEAARLEAERRAAEEAARLETERETAAEEAARLEAERRAAEEAARIEAERKAAEEAARLEAERKAAEEAARLEAERAAAEETARLEAERKAAEEAARLEAERAAAEEAARLEAERKAAEEAARLEAERAAAEEAARLEAERKAAEEAARLEAERAAAEEAARLEAERKAAEEAARLDAEQKAREEAERNAAEEAARLEAERQAAEEAARLEAERIAAEEAARLEAERKAAEEAARLESERKAAEEAARLEAERKAAEEAAQLEAEQKAREEAEREAAALAETERELRGADKGPPPYVDQPGRGKRKRSFPGPAKPETKQQSIFSTAGGVKPGWTVSARKDVAAPEAPQKDPETPTAPPDPPPRRPLTPPPAQKPDSAPEPPAREPSPHRERSVPLHRPATEPVVAGERAPSPIGEARRTGPAAAAAGARAARRRAAEDRKRGKPGLIRRVVTNKWLRRFAVLCVLLVLAGVGTFVGVIGYYSRDLPSVEALRDYRPPIVTQIYASDGRLVGEVYEKQRYVVPYSRIPEELVQAFVAAEDAQFFEHHGIDYMGIVRAMIRNIEAGEFSQGASTITQQVARSFLLTREKKLSRKIKEAILAYRIEANFSKEYILYLYLNQIFLGHGAYGVEAASQLYFGKHVEDITLPEAALIAGLPQAPSRYSPNNNFSSAKARQRYCLDQMVSVGFIEQTEADSAYDAKLRFQRKRDKNLDLGPYFVEHVRRYLVDQYGHDTAYREGLTVYTTMDSELQEAANQAVQWGVRQVDHRVGLYEEFGHVEPAGVEAELAAIDIERYLASLPYDPSYEPPTSVGADSVPPLQADEVTRGVVAEVNSKYLWVDVGSIRGILHHADGKWAYEPNEHIHTKWRQIESMRDAYEVGDVIQVRVVNPTESWKKTLKKDVEYPRLELDQEPQVEASLLSMRVTDGAVLAMVGGYDYRKSEFNRAIQANRQVGSTFKPFVYSAALDCNRHEGGPHCGPKGEDLSYTPSSIIVDSPIVGFKQKAGGGVEAWKPGNAGGDFLGDTTLRRALVLSRNIVTLKIAQAMGINYLHNYVQRFGFKTDLEPNLAMALGSAALTLEEMVRAYTVLANLGDRQGPYYIREVRDRDGRVLETTAAGERVPDVMDDVTAYQMVRLMRDVVNSGTATKALVLGVPLQGKTGTTNDYRDAWFMGYNAQVVTGVWVGFDDFARSLGRGQYGGDCALPIWIEYMKVLLEKYPECDIQRPPGVEFVQVDSESGLLTDDGTGVGVAFRAGTAPTSYVNQAGEVDSNDFLNLDGGF